MGMFGNFFGGESAPQPSKGRENLGGNHQAIPDNEGVETPQSRKSLSLLLDKLIHEEPKDEERIAFITKRLDELGGPIN